MSYSYREAALNWLALGLLLAAWNASDDGGPRPARLRGYSHVSVRAATRTLVVHRGVTVM